MTEETKSKKLIVKRFIIGIVFVVAIITVCYLGLLAIANSRINKFKLDANTQISSIKNSVDANKKPTPVDFKPIFLIDELVKLVNSGYAKLENSVAGNYANICNDLYQYELDIKTFNEKTAEHNKAVENNESTGDNNSTTLKTTKSELDEQKTKIENNLKSLQNELNSL